MNDKLPFFFSLLFVSDILVTLLGIMMWGGFPYTNDITIEMANSGIGWIILKTVMYLTMIYTYKYSHRHAHKIETIFVIITVAYGISVLISLHGLTVEPHHYCIFPVTFDTTDSYNSISAICRNIT